MRPEILLALISDLYAQLLTAKQSDAAKDALIAELRASAEDPGSRKAQ